MKRVSSYDPDALLPRVGTRWVWEIDLFSARALIEVVDVVWNGEEWWVTTKSLLPYQGPFPSRDIPNDLGRFWEAVTPVGSPYRRTERRSPEVRNAG